MAGDNLYFAIVNTYIVDSLTSVHAYPAVPYTIVHMLGVWSVKY